MTRLEAVGKRGLVRLQGGPLLLAFLLPRLEITDQVRDFPFEGVANVAGCIGGANVRMLVALGILKMNLVPKHELFVPGSVMHSRGSHHPVIDRFRWLIPMLSSMPTGSPHRDLAKAIILRPSMVPFVTPIEASDNLIPEEVVVSMDVNLLDGMSLGKSCYP